MEKRVKQLIISAEEMDRRQSAARRMNKNESNRLRQQYEQFRGNHEVITIEIDQEMKKIQNELNDIREITGYEEYARNSEDSANASNTSSKRKKKQRVSKQNRRVPKANETKLTRRLTREETLVGNKVRFSAEHSSALMSERSTDESRAIGPTNEPMPRITTTRRTSRSGFSKKNERLPKIVKSAMTDSRSLLERDAVEEARVQARKRLLGESEANEPEEGELPSTTTDDDFESYMYVPPDGRKRTVYLIPPLEDLLKEARKARYLRIPKRLHSDEEDPEKELSIDEIFSKRV